MLSYPAQNYIFRSIPVCSAAYGRRLLIVAQTSLRLKNEDSELDQERCYTGRREAAAGARKQKKTVSSGWPTHTLIALTSASRIWGKQAVNAHIYPPSLSGTGNIACNTMLSYTVLDNKFIGPKVRIYIRLSRQETLLEIPRVTVEYCTGQ